MWITFLISHGMQRALTIFILTQNENVQLWIVHTLWLDNVLQTIRKWQQNPIDS